MVGNPLLYVFVSFFGPDRAQRSIAVPIILSLLINRNIALETCQKLPGGRGVETEGGSQLFETAEKGGVMKSGLLKGGGSCKYVSVIV